MRRLGKLFVVLLLAYAWTWSSLLKDFGWITDKNRFWVLIGATLLFIVQQIHVIWGGTPADAAAVEERREVITLYLRHLFDAYSQIAGQHGGNVATARVNLMLPARHWWLLGRLKIYYDVAPNGPPYTVEERSMVFKKGEGACGLAWKQRQIALFDATDATFVAAKDTLKARNKELTEHIQSVLAVPVFVKHKVVAVLCMDSELPVDQSRFGSDEVTLLARAHADKFAPFCFAAGVK